MGNELAVRDDLKDGVFILGNAEKNVMVKYTDKGACQSIKKIVRLFLSKKHFYEAQYPGSGVFDYTIHTYRAINKYLNLDDLSPRNFELDGVTYTNPSINRDAMGRKTLIKGLGVIGGRGPTGKYQIVSRYMEEDVQFGMIQSLTKKMKQSKNKALGDYVDADSKPTPGRKRFPIDEFISLDIDTKHTAFREVYQKYVDDLMTGEKKLESKVWRNAFKNHPAVLLPPCVPIPLYNENNQVIDHFVDVTITIWLEEIQSDKDEAVDDFLEKLDKETVILDQGESMDETDLTEEELQESEDIFVEILDEDISTVEVQAEVVTTKEQQTLIDWIKSAPVDYDLENISSKPLEEWSIHQLKIAKDEINKIVGGN